MPVLDGAGKSRDYHKNTQSVNKTYQKDVTPKEQPFPYSMQGLKLMHSALTLSVPEMKIAEFANNVGLDEEAHNEPPHLDLHCLPSSH